MSSLTSALRIGTSGLNISQSALSTISHNVVNANTPGYSRQVSQAVAQAVNGFGNGVTLSDIQRVTDRFVNQRSFVATSDMSYAQTRKTYLDTLEGVVTGASSQGGLEAVAANFFKSMSQLSNDPANSALKRNVVQQAQLFTQTVRDIDADLTVTATDADNAITAELNNVNQLLKDISSLNAQIAAISLSTVAGAGANDLIDARDQKITALAQNFKLQVNENGSSGSVRISLENGRRLVDEAGYVQLKRTPGTPQGIALQAVQVDGSLSTTELPIDPATLTSGKIKALSDVRDTLVGNIRAQIETFADTARTEVNRVASQGSPFPPQRTYTSGNTGSLSAVGDDLYATTQFAGLAGATLNISVVNSLGQPAITTLGGAAITLPAAPGPFSLNDLADLINNHPTIGNTALGGTNGVIASAAVDADGNPFLQIQAANSAQRIVMANGGTGDFLGTLGMNNLFTGTGASDFNVRSSFVSNPELLPGARMRSTDGGLSSLDNQNMLALAALADVKQAFSAAGGLGAQNATVSGYATQMVSNLSVVINDAKDRVTFTSNISNQLEKLRSEVSGVNVNEELSQMLVYQNSFQASARIVSVVDSLLEELVNLVR